MSPQNSCKTMGWTFVLTRFTSTIGSVQRHQIWCCPALVALPASRWHGEVANEKLQHSRGVVNQRQRSFKQGPSLWNGSMGTAMSSRLQQSFCSPKYLTNLSTLQSNSKVTTKSVWNYSRTSCSRNTLRLTTSSPLNKKHSFGTGTSGKLLVSTPTEPLEYSAVALAPTRANYKWARLAFLVG